MDIEKRIDNIDWRKECMLCDENLLKYQCLFNENKKKLKLAVEALEKIKERHSIDIMAKEHKMIHVDTFNIAEQALKQLK